MKRLKRALRAVDRQQRRVTALERQVARLQQG
jgi:polyhydroxyalkanoate synthesis regulator phasin